MVTATRKKRLAKDYSFTRQSTRYDKWHLPTLFRQSGDMLESFPETLNISWFPEKLENFHALVLSSMSAAE
jgi:hypothetical protein